MTPGELPVRSEMFCSERLGCPTGSTDDQDHARSGYQRDFDRIVFSTAFRRLHGKTQVVPIPDSDMTHTRLTHSLEVASVGRSLGAMVGPELCIDASECGALVAAAALAHDIGNPPFGHAGEDAIGHFFSTAGSRYVETLHEHQRLEFTEFEGNAMAFRMLARSKPRLTANTGGMSLTLATLAAFAKYPGTVSTVDKSLGRASRRKWGFFESEIELFTHVAQGTGLVQLERGRWARHPLAFLTEAADDICYRVIDCEDGAKLGMVPIETARTVLEAVCAEPSARQDLSGLTRINDDHQKIGFLRAKAINSLIEQVVRLFVDRKDEILLGDYDKSLCDEIPGAVALDAVFSQSKLHVYTNRNVVKIEAAGFEVLGGLLNAFLEAIEVLREATTKSKAEAARARKVLQLMQPEYLPYEEGLKAEELLPHADLYSVLLGAVEFVAGMTDTFAVDTFRVLRGIDLPNYSP